MRAAKRWRYYCDFCKKVSGSKHVIEKHEKGCTANPNRICGMCAIVDNVQLSMDELKLLIDIKPTPVDWPDGLSEPVAELTDESFKAIQEATSYCPACTLAVMRVTDVWYPAFDFKKDYKEFWDDYNDSQMREEWAFCGG